MTGPELHQLLLDKWGYSYDVQLRRRGDRVLLQVMWRYLEQASFPLSPGEYRDRLEAVATYLNGWGEDDRVRDYIRETCDRPRLGKAVTIVLDLGGRASEWFVE